MKIGAMKCGAILKKKGSKYYYYTEAVDKDFTEITAVSDLTKKQITSIESFLKTVYDEDTAANLIQTTYESTVE